LAISKQRKDELIAQYTEQLKECQGIILTDYRGLSVGDMDTVRRALRPSGGIFQVVKNRLLKLALKEAELSLPEEWLIGPTAVGFCYGEVPPMAKIFVDTAKELEALQLKGGVIGTSAVTADQVRTVADLPPREILLSHVLGSINAPASQVVGVVASGVRQILNVLQAYVDKLEESSGVSGTAMEQAAEPA
jgi:large subunit ribosomal protein L10